MNLSDSLRVDKNYFQENCVRMKIQNQQQKILLFCNCVILVYLEINLYNKIYRKEPEHRVGSSLYYGANA